MDALSGECTCSFSYTVFIYARLPGFYLWQRTGQKKKLRTEMQYDCDWHAMPCASTLATPFTSRRSTLSANRIRTSKSVIHRFFYGRAYLFGFVNQYVIITHHRYNIFKRIETLLAKVTHKKPLKLGATFLPKYKRVLVKHPKRVLNKPKKKKKKNNPPKKIKKMEKPVVPDLLCSQSSITSLWGSQCSVRATCSESEKKVATPVDELLDSQCSLAFLDSQGRFTTSQTSTVCMHVCSIPSHLTTVYPLLFRVTQSRLSSYLRHRL